MLQAPTSTTRSDLRHPFRRHRSPSINTSSHQPSSSKAIPIITPPITATQSRLTSSPQPINPQDQTGSISWEQGRNLNFDRSHPKRFSTASHSSSSVSSFGSVSHVRSPIPPPDQLSIQDINSRPRLPSAIRSPIGHIHFGPEAQDSSWSSRDPPPHKPHHTDPPRVSIPQLPHFQSLQPPHTSITRVSWLHHTPATRSLPDLRHIRPHAPDIVAARRRLEDNSTKPFTLESPPFSDHDVPLPQPYNAAYPHPLTAYASPGVNSAAILAVRWKEILSNMMETDLDLVKGTILAASDRDINPPALMIPVYEGEGCGIPERLWSRFESMSDGPTPNTGASGLFSPASASLPPRFAQAGIQVVSTPGGRSAPSSTNSHLIASTATDAFPAVRTNFSNVLRRASVEVESGRPAPPTRRLSQQPTPFHKTELCRTWEHEGTCKYGSNCQFAHGLLELRMPVSGMQTPPTTHYPLNSRNEDTQPPAMRARPYERQNSYQSNLSFIGEHDSPLIPHHAHLRTSTPSPIGNEREFNAWRTVPVPISAPIINQIPNFAEYQCSSRDLMFEAPRPAPQPPQYREDHHHFTSPPRTMSQKASMSSLSASARSFQSHSTPSLGYSFSFSPPSDRLASSSAHDGPCPEAEGPDWEALKRSIDATTVRSVWEE